MQNTKTTPGRSARRSRAEWTEEVARWRSSGLGSAEYAAKRGLRRGSLLWWSSQLGADVAQDPASAARVAFVPVHVREKQHDAVARGVRGIEVVLRNGRCVRVTGAVDTVELARVIVAVEEAR